MTSTNDGKEVKNNQNSGTKGKTYLIELYKSLEARLSETGDASERTKHLCSAWRSVHSLCQHSAPNTQTHLLNWLPRHTARTVLQTSWQKPEREDDRRSLEAAINDFIATAKSSATNGTAPWEVALTSRGEWFKRLLESPWDHPVLTSLLNASGSPPTDDEVLTWLKEERGVTFVVRLHTLVGERCDDIAVSLASAVMDRVRAAIPPIDDAQEQGAPPVNSGPTFGDKLKNEAGFTPEVWDSITDIEFVLLHKRDSKRCIALAKQTPLGDAYPLIERLQKRLEAAPHEKRLWKNGRDVAILIAQVMIARCMVLKACEGVARTALYCCAFVLARLLTSRLPSAADALAAQAPTARHLYTMAFAVEKQLLPTHEDMRPYVCELYVRALTAGMNELERLKMKTEKETEARTMERTLASWFVQLGTVLSKSTRIACECTLTAFSLQPSQGMYEHIEKAPPLAPVLTDSNDPKEEPTTSELGSWANDSHSQTNLVKTSETLKLKATQNQANVLSTAIFNEGEALGLSQMLCQDIAVLLAGPRVKTLSWDMDRTLLLENCRAYMEKTHGGTRLPTRELKYLNIDLKQYQHLPEEQDDDENDPYYGIERGYEHLAVLEEPEDIWPDMNHDKSESASSIEDDYLLPRRKKKTKRIKKESSSEEDSGPLSVVAEAKRTQKKKERPHSKERSKERAKKKQEPVDPLAPDTEKKQKPPKEKKQRKKKEKAPKVIAGKRTSLAKLLGFKVGNTKRRHKEFTPVATPVTDSDYDSQGKNSLTSLNSEGTEHDSLETSWRTTHKQETTAKNSFTITTNKPKQNHRAPILSKMQYRPQNPNAPRPGMSSYTPSTPDGRTTFDNLKQYPEAVRANLTRILEYRRQKEIEKKLEAQTARTSAIQRQNILPLQTNISPKAVVIPEIPKSYISKEQADRFAEIMRSQKSHDSVIQYARNLSTSKSEPSGSDSRRKTQEPNANTLKMADLVNTSYERLMAEIAERHSKSQEAKSPQTQYQPPPTPLPAQKSSFMTAGQRDFQNFLQNYERKSVMPHPDEMKHKSKKPMPVSRVVPVVPNTPKMEMKPVQSAKPPIQQKKPEATLNTFSRLSYMHKNKQNEMKNKAPVQKPCDTSSYQDVSNELDEIIKEHQQAQRRVIQAKRDREMFTKVQEVDKKCDSKTNPLLSNLLSDTSKDLINRRETQYKSNQIPQNLSSKSIVQSGAPTKSNSVSSAALNTALSEKDQNDLWNLLRQQNKMNNSHYSTSIQSKPSTSTASNSQPMTQYNTIGHNQQQPCHANQTPALEECTKTSLENKIINVLSNTLLKPGCHEVNKSLSVNIVPQTVSKSSDKLCNLIRNQGKVNKNAFSKAAEKSSGSETPEWQSVMQDIIKLKTPSRESTIIELPSRQSSHESVYEKCLKKPSLLTTPTKLETDKHQAKVDRQKPVITSVQNVIITKKGIQLQDTIHPQKDGHKTSKHPAITMNENSKKATNQPAKKLPQEIQGKQFTYSGPKQTDPFISGIPNSDYDLLEELMDDDLRKEIGELSSDEDSYNSAAQSFLKQSKTNEKQRVSIQYNKCVNEASPPKPATDGTCLNTYQSSSETPLVTVKPVSQCANKMSMTHGSNQSRKTFSVDSILANTTRQIPSSTSTENQVYGVQNTKTPVLMNANNIYIAALPQQAPVQNVVLVGSEIVYGGYSTLQTPSQQPVTNYAPNYVAVNNAPMTLYQTQYTAPVVIGASVSVPVINKIPPSTISGAQNVSNNNTQKTSTHNDGHSPDTQANVSEADCPQKNCKSQDEIKASERKVLSEVQDFATTENVDNTRNQMIENDNIETVKKDLTANQERLKKKRLAILNREIYHRCGEKTIPLSYSPLPKTEAVSKDDKLTEKFADTDDEKLLAQIKNNLQDLSDAINEVSGPATPDSTESKENKSIPIASCRRILLRSSNKMTPKTAVKLETPAPKKTRAKSKATDTEIDTEAPVIESTNPDNVKKREEALAKTKRKSKPKLDQVEKTDLKPSRVSKRIRNKKTEKSAKKTTQSQNEPAESTTKKKQQTSKCTNNSQSQHETCPIEHFDIESELQGSIITKSASELEPTSSLKENGNIPLAPTDETFSNVKNAHYKIVHEDLQKSIDDNNMHVDEECAREAIEPVKQNNDKDNIDQISVSSDPTTQKTNDAETKNQIMESKIKAKNVTVSPELTADVKSDNKPVCQETTEVKIDDEIQQKIEKSQTQNENIIGDETDVKLSSATPKEIGKNTSQVASDILKPTSDVSMICNSKNDLCVKAKPEASISTHKVSTVAAIKKTDESTEISIKTDTNDYEKPYDVTTIPETMTETENKITLLQKEDIDLDMSVTCDEATSKPRPVLESVLTAKSKSINSTHKNDKKIIESRSKADIENINDNDVVLNYKQETFKPKRDDKSTSADFKEAKTVPCIENVSVEPTPEKWLTPDLVTSRKTSNTEMLAKYEKTLNTNLSASDDDDVVLIDNKESNDVVRNSSKSPVLFSVPKVVENFPNQMENGPVHTSVTKPHKSLVNVLGAKVQETHKEKSSEKISVRVGIEEVPQDFKDKICIEQLTCNDPSKKKIRVCLPNGRKFKATVHGHLNVTYDTLFTFPSIRNALLYGLDCKKLVATVDLQNPEKILSAKIVQASTPNQKAQLVDTIDLLSDDEESQNTNEPKSVETNEFVFETKIGRLKIPPMDKDLFVKHRAQLKQKSHILLQRVDEKPKVHKKVQGVDSSPRIVNQCDMVSAISINRDGKPNQATKIIPKTDISTIIPVIPAQADITATIPNQYVTGLINDIQNNILTGKVKPKVIPDVVEIDDSSNDSVDINKLTDTKPEDKTIDLLKNSLLHELGVNFSSKITIKRVQKESSDDDVKIIDVLESEVVKKTAPAKKRNRRKVVKLSTLPSGKSCRLSDLDIEEQHEIKRRKCAIKLIRCDDLAKINEAEIDKVEKMPNLMVDDEEIVISEKFKLLDSIDENSADDRSSSPVIEFFDVLAALDTTFPNAGKFVKVIPLSCQAPWLSTKVELRTHCMNDAAVEGAIENDEGIVKDWLMPLSCDANWFCTKSKTHSLSLANTLTYDNMSIDEEIRDISMKETTSQTCGDGKSNLHLQSMDDADVRLNLPDFDHEMRDQRTVARTMPMNCEASWLTAKSALHLEMQETKSTQSLVLLDTAQEMFELKSAETISLNCESNYFATKPMLYSLHDIVKSVQSDDHKNCDDRTSEDHMPLSCEANWLNTKQILHLQRIDSIRSDSLNDYYISNHLGYVIPLSCNAFWLETKAALHLQRFDIIINGDNVEILKTYNEITSSSPLSCKAAWFTTKPIVHFEALNNAFDARSKYLATSTFKIETNGVSSLTSKTLEILQDANVINQYRLLQKSNAVSLKRRLPSMKKPAVCKLRKLNNETSDSILNDCYSITLNTTASDVTNVSESILNDMTGTIKEIGIEVVITLESFKKDTKCNKQTENANLSDSNIKINNSQCENLQDSSQKICVDAETLDFDKELYTLSPVTKLQDELDKTESRAPSSILDTNGLLAFENYIPSPRAESSKISTEDTFVKDDKLQPVKTENRLGGDTVVPPDDSSAICSMIATENSICSSIPNTENEKRIDSIQSLSSNYDDIEANLAEIFGESLIDDKNKDNVYGDIGTFRKSEICESKEEGNENHITNSSNYCIDIERSLEETVDEVVKDDDGKILENNGVIEVEVIDDWETEIIETSLENEHSNQNTGNQNADNSEEKQTCLENNEISIEESIAKLDHMYFNSFAKGIQPMYENKEDHVVFYVPTDSMASIVSSVNEDLEEEIVDMQSDEIVDNFVITNCATQNSNISTDIFKEETEEVLFEKTCNKEPNAVIDKKTDNNIIDTCVQLNKFETKAVSKHVAIEEKLDLNENSKNSSYEGIFNPLSDVEDVASQLGNVKKKRKAECYNNIDCIDTEIMSVKVPNRTYAKCPSPVITRRRSLKRKIDMSDTKTREKKYRKAKNIDYPKFQVGSFTKTVYTKEFKSVIDYSSSQKFSFTMPFHKDIIDVHAQLKSWPILDTYTKTKETQVEVNEELFAEVEKPNAIVDPLTLTLAEEINSEFDENSYTPSNVDTNFSMGFGERSGRVIQESIDGELITFSAATLSDVKQLQPLLPSDVKETCVQTTFVDNILDQKLKAKIFVDHLNLRERVRAFFEKSKAEFHLELKQNQKKNNNFESDCDASDWPFGDLTSTKSFRPSPVDVTVNVVQVGQLPVSAAAQNPVTCDPRVTHVSNASPSQCSPENSIGDELQTSIKTEYTELTTADMSLPMMQEYVTQHHSMPSDSQEPTNAFGTNNSMNVPSDMKSIVKIELMEDTSEDQDDDNMNYENNGSQQLPNGNIGRSMQYQFDNPTNNVMAESSSNTRPIPNSSTMPKSSETFSENKQTSDVAEKSDQLAHAMNAAGIPANKALAKPSNSDLTMSQNLQPNVTISQANSNNFAKTTPINAIALQQALAQILPPSLNQGTSEINPQASANPQVLHIVQGNNSQSVINKPNGTQLLHIVQNKSAGNSNGTPAPQQNTFSGLSLVDGTLQQGGNQFLHIVNAANQKNANAGQLLKRVNLLTNLANVQGSNEQKMVQFVCKSADGKSIQLPHQRSMVLRLQPLDPTTVPTTPKQNDNQEHASSSGTSHSVSEKESSPQEMKSRSLYEENYAKFVQSDAKFAQNGDQKSGQEKATSLPKFNQVFGKQVYQEKQDELDTENMPQNPDTPEENNPPLEQINDMANPQMLIRKPNQTQPTHVQPNLVQQIKQTIGPMNIQTMHGGVIYTRQIPVNIGNGQTINLITVPSTELVDDSAQKQQTDGKFNQEGDTPIIKIVPTNQATTANGSGDDNNSQLKANNEGGSQPSPQPQPQPVLTQMRIKLPMLSKAPQMVGGTRVVRPSFFQIQRNVIGGANQQVYQQLVLTAAPPIGQSIRLPTQVQKPKIPSETQSSPESQMSSSTLEQLREFDMVLEQVKERSTVQPGSSTATNSFSKLKGSPDNTDAPTPSTSNQESPTQVLYSVGNSQTLNMVNYVTRKSTITSTTTTSFVRSPDSTGTVESPSSSTHSHLPHTVTSDSCASSCASEAAASSQPKPKKKKPKPSTSNSNPFNIKNTPKPSSQKPLEDEQTTQRILYILAEYKEQVENSPDKDKPAPRRRNNPAAPNAGSSKRKKSSSGSRRRDMSPVLGEDSCRTMGSEDSSCGTSLGECNECLETHSPEESPKKVVRRLTFEQETQITQTRTTTTTTTVPQRNVIVTDGQAFAVRGATGKPATTVLMPANYLLPVSMVKGGQQIAIVTNRGPKLLVGAGEGGTGGTLLFQRLIGPGGLKPVIARPGVRHIRLPTAALHNLQTFNIAAPASTVPPPDSTASPAPAPTPPDLVDTRAMSSPWPDRDAGEIKPERGNSSPEGSEPWNLPSSSIADDYGYEEIVRTDNMDRTVLDAIPDRYSPDLEAQRIFDKMFDNDSKKSMYDSRCSYDVDASDDDKHYHQVVHRKDGRHTTRLTHVSAAALRHKYAILEHELRLQKSLSEECEDLGVDSPSASELFPEAELLFAPSPAHEQTIDQCHTPQPTIHAQGIPQPDLDDQIATDQLLTHKERTDDLDINLDDVGEIVTVGEEGMTTIPLDHEEFARSHEEFARSHPNTTFHSEPEDGEVPPFTIAQGAKGRQITFHSRVVPGTVVMAPQTTVISQATIEASGSQSTVKFSDIDNMINAMPSPQPNLNMPSVLVKDNESMTKFDRLLNESREMSPNMTSNPASAIVHSTGNGTQVIRRVQYENRRDNRFLGEDSDAMIGGDMKMTEERRDLQMEDNSSERHPELFWDQSRADRKRFDFSSDSEKCCKSPYDETNSDSSGVGAHTRLDSVIKAARSERRRSDGSSTEESHPPLRTYPAKRHQHAHHSQHHSDVDRSLTGKTRASDRCHDVKDESRRRASNRGVVKRGCHCCIGSSVAPKPKKSRPKKSYEYPHN